MDDSVLDLRTVFGKIKVLCWFFTFKKIPRAFKWAINIMICIFGSRDISYSEYPILGHKVVLTHLLWEDRGNFFSI
jgi:hypothetical protein